jgi:hypothetical protein
MSVQPGWQPDPTGRHQYRYWDGSAWSDAVADNGRQGSDPFAVTEAVNTAAPMAWYAQTWFVILALLFCFPIGVVLVWLTSWQRGMKIAVTGIVAALFVFGVISSATSSNTSTGHVNVAAAPVQTTSTAEVTAPPATRKPQPTTTTVAATTTVAPMPTTVHKAAPIVTAPPPPPPPPPTSPSVQCADVTDSAGNQLPCTGGCTPGYSPCIPPGDDVDCAGGSGNGPRYVAGPIQVSGSDPYGLDRDGNGVGCES